MNDAREAALRRVSERLEKEPDAIDALFEKAQLLARLGRDGAAKDGFVAVLRRDPSHFGALTDLGGLALATGYRSAALTAYRQAAAQHPGNPHGLVNLANLLLEDGALAEARDLYQAALRIEPELAYAHQGLAHALTKLGEPEKAAPHWDKGYAQHSIVARPYRGMGAPLRVLLIVSVRGGNIPTNVLLDDHIFAVTALHAEYHDPSRALPDHDVVFNAVGDADLCERALAEAAHIVARTTAPVINRPETIMHTGRSANAARLSTLDGIVVPRTIELPREMLEGRDAVPALMQRGLRVPLLLRSPGFHTGENFLRVDCAEDLGSSVRQLPGDRLLAIEYLDARGRDGLARKYRVMTIGGKLHPLHLAIARDWKVHYFTSDMASDAAYREEERLFLADMAGTIGAPAVQCLMRLSAALGIDYGGIDFGLSRDRRILLFEANATMAIVPPSAEPVWDYRRASINAAIEAARQMIFTRLNA